MMTCGNGSVMYFYLLLASSIVTTLYLFNIFRKKRFCFLKPSIIFMGFFNIFLQWPSVIYYDKINNLLSSSLFGFIAIFSLVPVIVLNVSSRYFFRSALTIYNHIGHPASVTRRVKYCLIVGIIAGAIIYSYYVSIRETGLLAILRGESGLMIALMREESLKLLPLFVRYIFVFVTKVLCPLIVLMSIREYAAYRSSGERFILLTQILFYITITVIISSISGARSPSVYIFLCIIAYIIFYNKLILKYKLLLKTALFVAIIFSIISVIQYLRSDSAHWLDAMENISYRTFAGTLFPGIFTISLTEDYGKWGIGAIPILRDVFEVQPISVANIVANTVFPDSAIKTGFLNASFMMTYYSYFGLIAFPLNILLVLFMDIIPWFVSKFIRPEFYCYAVVGYSVPMFTLLHIDYSTIFISGGIVFMLLILMAIPKDSIRMLQTTST